MENIGIVSYTTSCKWEIWIFSNPLFLRNRIFFWRGRSRKWHWERELVYIANGWNERHQKTFFPLRGFSWKLWTRDFRNNFSQDSESKNAVICHLLLSKSSSKSVKGMWLRKVYIITHVFEKVLFKSCYRFSLFIIN